jgi:hypothetical protein
MTKQTITFHNVVNAPKSIYEYTLLHLYAVLKTYLRGICISCCQEMFVVVKQHPQLRLKFRFIQHITEYWAVQGHMNY